MDLGTSMTKENIDINFRPEWCGCITRIGVGTKRKKVVCRFVGSLMCAVGTGRPALVVCLLVSRRFLEHGV